MQTLNNPVSVADLLAGYGFDPNEFRDFRFRQKRNAKY